ncbi:conjugative transfer protein MobI(A/C) [Azospirillum sp. BE72]|uniref:conjugative transfer protein MobI(A/C) n=1 Tax=Azospirillum sp. BE72 TaxID=2817776 RepID=UPI0028547B52|nr:conjugative transfer protein MobI(A/C) [Azospirillum sp. BE72]MDR6775683.1 hypothetical protein [Azospirillum sp. BE72]
MILEDEIKALRERTGASFTDLLRALLQSEGDILEAEARELATRFYEECEEVRQQQPASQHNRYLARVARRNVGVSIRWAKVRFFGAKGNRRRMDENVPRGETAQYPMTSFPDAQVWEKVLISGLEERFGPLRSRSSMIAKMAVLAATYRQVEEGARQRQAALEADLAKS